MDPKRKPYHERRAEVAHFTVQCPEIKRHSSGQPVSEG